MKKNKSNNTLTFKDKLEIAEAIFTILVSIMAIWGSLVAWENGFWHKLERVTDRLHQELVLEKDIQDIASKAQSTIKEIEKKL